MRRLAFLVVLLLAARGAWAQNTKVTAVVIDPNGHPYANGTAHASLVCPGNAQAYSGTSPIPRDTPTVGLDGNGKLTQTLWDTSLLVDVNRAPISCSYQYSVAEYCQIATFRTGNLTGITGAGPVDLSSQINSFAVPLSFACTPPGGISAVSWFLNNVLVGLEPGYDVIPGTNITIGATDDSAHSRVHYTINGPSGGCLLPGVNTGVLSEHPALNCYDSLNFTWDDGASKQNLQAGLTNTVGTALTFAFGSGHTLTGSSKAMTMGTSNTLVCQQCNTFGDNNSITAVGAGGAAANTQIYIQGQNNTLQGNSVGSDYHVIGFNNQIKMGTNVADSILSVFDIGEALLLDAASAFPANAVSLNVINVHGKGNQAQLLNNGAALNNWSAFGDGNTTEDAIGTVTGLTQIGELNDANIYNGVYVSQYGYNNHFDGGSDNSTFQYANILGTTNHMQSSGNVGINKSVVAGYNNILANCHDCFLFGENANLTGQNSFIGIGLSATPEVKITPGAAAVNPWPVTQMQTISICASGCTVTATPCSITSGASYDVCTNSITWPNAFADANYTVICNGEVTSAHASAGNGSTNFALTAFAQKGSLTTTTFIVVTQNQRSNTAAFDEIDCTGTHR